MSKPNAAQQLRQALGIDIVEYVKTPRNESSTKRGPGRRHVDGAQRGPRPNHQGGDFGGQHTTSAARRYRRATIAKIGRRQYLKRMKALKRNANEQRAEP